MRAIILIEWGPRRWQKTALSPGETARLGRHEQARIVLAHDEEVSGLHCEISWDGSRCTVRDLGSIHGTFLNGERVESGEIGHGEWIQVGETVLSVYHEGVVGPWTPEAGEPRVSRDLKSTALSLLRAEQASLFAVLDAARDDRILTLLRSSVDRAESLYDGQHGESLEDVAPFLVALHENGRLLTRLVEEGWGEGWGIYLTSRRPFEEVRRQLRRQLVIRGKRTGALHYFRFYDPMVLADFARGCNPREKQLLFGEVNQFIVERATGELVRLRTDATI